MAISPARINTGTSPAPQNAAAEPQAVATPAKLTAQPVVEAADDAREALRVATALPAQLNLPEAPGTPSSRRNTPFADLPPEAQEHTARVDLARVGAGFADADFYGPSLAWGLDHHVFTPQQLAMARGSGAMKQLADGHPLTPDLQRATQEAVAQGTLTQEQVDAARTRGEDLLSRRTLDRLRQGALELALETPLDQHLSLERGIARGLFSRAEAEHTERRYAALTALRRVDSGVVPPNDVAVATNLLTALANKNIGAADLRRGIRSLPARQVLEQAMRSVRASLSRELSADV